MHRPLSLLLLLLFTLPVFAQNTILIVGDSLSSGHGLPDNQGWVTLLEKRLKEHNYPFAVINTSISGNTTSQGLAQLEKALQDHRPKITIIELGGNDSLRGISLTTIRDNLQKMITLTQNASSTPLLIGVALPPNYGEAYINQFKKIYTDLAEDNQISVVILERPDAKSHLMQADNIHPNAAAQSVMLDKIWPMLEDILKKGS